MEQLKSNSTVLLSAKSSFLFFAAVMLVYFIAGAFIQTNLGLLGIFLNQIFLVGTPVVLVSYVKGFDLLDWPSWKNPGLKELLVSLLGILLLSFVIDQLIALQDKYLPPPSYLETFFEELTAIRSWKEGLVKVISLAIAPAFCEEIFFRGLLLPSWSKKFGWILGNIFTGLAFAIAHGNLLYFHFYFILGFYLGWLFKWRNSLWLPILAHFGNNGWTLLSGNLFGK